MKQLGNDFFKDILIENSRSFGYVVDTSNYRLSYINDYLLNRLQSHYTKLPDYANQICYEFLHNASEPCEQCNIHKLQVNQPEQSHYHNTTRGEWYSTVEIVIEEDSRRYLFHSSYNLTNEITQISDLRRTIEDNNAIIKSAQTLLDQISFEDSINKLLEIICNYYGGEYACLFERDYDKYLSNVTHKFHIEDVSFIPLEHTKSFEFTLSDRWTSFLRDKSYAYFKSTDEVDTDIVGGNYYNRFLESDRQNLLVVSLKDGERILGAIEIDNITQNTDNIEFISTISAFIVNKLNIHNTNSRLQQNVIDLEKKNYLNNTMLECIKTLVDDNDIETAMTELLDIVCDYFKAGSINIFHKKDDVMLECKYSFAIDKPIEDVKVVDIPMQGMCNLFNYFNKDGVGRINSTKELISVKEFDFSIDYDIMVDKGIETLFMTPLLQNGEIVGFLGVENPTENLGETFFVKTIATFIINHISKYELHVKLERLSYMDSLTDLYNRNFYNNYIDDFKNNKCKSVGVIFADVNGLKKANDNLGHELGDRLIKWSAKFLKSNINGLIFRIGGDEFVGIIEDIDEVSFNQIVDELVDKVNHFGEVHISIGNAWSDSATNIESTIAKSDESMYERKQQYYKIYSQDERSVKVSLQELKASIEALVLD